MALARLVTFVPFTLIKSADVNGELNNILNNPIALLSPTTGPINFNGQLHTGLVPSAITATSATNGQVLQVSGGASVFAAAPTVFFPSRVSNLNGILSSQSGSFSAESYVMRTTSGTASWTVTATSSYSASVGTAGPAAGGRDQAAVFASTYVHWYAISTGTGSTAPAGLVSSNPPTVGPVALPANYSGWTYLGGSVYTSASTAVSAAHYFRGNETFYTSEVASVTNSNTTAITTVSLALVVPPNAPKFTIQLNVTSTDTATNDTVSIYITSSGSFATALVPAGSGGIVGTVNQSIRMPNVGQQYFYNNSTNVPLTTISIAGYVMPNGDV